MAVDLESILGRLRGVHKSGQGWSSQCPAHEDKKPSLSVTQQNGKILLHCFAGCTTEDVCQQLGIALSDLSTSEPHLVETYDYTDEAGKLLFQVLRYEGKKFKQRQPDNNGGWRWNLNGVRRVPYHLPEIVRAEHVLIVEGEKDANTGSKLGFVTTTNAGGALKWKPEYSDTLKGKHVVIVPDADPPGRQHAREVALSLVYKAASIKVLNLDLAKDLTEWAEHGGTYDHLIALIGQTPEWKEAEGGGGPQLEQYSCSEFLAAEFTDAGRPLLAGLIERESRTLIIGKPKMMKSLLAFNIAFEAACGFRVLGKFPPDNMVKSLYGQFEDRRGEVQKRLKKFKDSHDGIAPLDCFFNVVVGRSFDLMEATSRGKLERAIEKFEPELLVLDVMRALFVGDILKTQDVRPFLEYLDVVRERYKLALILVHYTPKHNDSPTASGSSYLDGWPDLIIHIHNKRKIKNTTLAELEFRARSMDLDPLTVAYEENATPIFRLMEGDTTEHEFEIARRFLTRGFAIRDVAQLFDTSHSTARRLIEQWIEESKVQLTSKPGRGAVKKFDFNEFAEAEK